MISYVTRQFFYPPIYVEVICGQACQFIVGVCICMLSLGLGYFYTFLFEYNQARRLEYFRCITD